ncbi:antibiotic biosynthesis monooxygenase [Frankia sp. AiPa1]|nr:antibiotic biosynthesis monooxygenase family protein [Frankia sp. AiPa1]MCL9760680.1 antibiotic biosynthesis monooxygenase [Frankia sp. AiPa1]
MDTPRPGAAVDGAAVTAVLEIARFEVRPGTERAFEDAYHQVRPELVGTPGCRFARMTRGVESPSSYVLLVEWDALERHLVDFRESERFVHWRAALGPYFAAPPDVAHSADIGPALV